LTTHPHLTPRVKKEFSYTSIPLQVHIGGRSSIRNAKTRHAVVTGTHLSWNSLHIKRRNAEWIGLLKGVIEGRIEVMRTQGRWRKRIQNDLQERKKILNMKQEALARTLRCRTAYGHVRQTTE